MTTQYYNVQQIGVTGPVQTYSVRTIDFQCSTATTTANYDGWFVWTNNTATTGTLNINFDIQQQQAVRFLRYAWFGTDSSQPLTGPFAYKDYAPVDEMPFEELKEWMKKLAEDPAFLKQQVEAQERLFASKHDVDPLYAKYAGNNVYVKEIKGLRTMLAVISKRLPGDEVFKEYLAKVKAGAKEREMTLKKLQAAEKKSEKLLKEWLSPAEYNYLQEHGELQIPSKLEKETIYIVKREAHSLVKIMEGGKVTKLACIHPNMRKRVPVGDEILAKILMLKTNEKELLKIANITRA